MTDPTRNNQVKPREAATDVFNILQYSSPSNHVVAAKFLFRQSRTQNLIKVGSNLTKFWLYQLCLTSAL